MTKTLKAAGGGAVLPAGAEAPITTLPEGGYEVRIDGFDDSGLIRCVFPGDFVKHYQAESVTDLATKVVGQLRGRYGATEVAFASVPKAIKAGEAFKVAG